VRILRRFFARLGNWGAMPPQEARMREEIEEHIALQTAENLRAGLPPEEARRQAVLKFGAVEAVKEAYRAEHRMVFVEALLQDVRFGFRTLRRSPCFTAVAILTIALGVGATTAIFSVVDATLLRPLSYPEPDRLVRIMADLPGVGAQDVGVSVPEWHDLQRSSIFEFVSPVGVGDVNLTGSSQPMRIRFSNVAPNYFALLGVKPEHGRSFDPQDRTPGFTLEAILSDGLWKRAFGSDPNIVGKSIELDSDRYQIVGVMPPGFHDPGRTAEARNIELWLASGFAAAPAPPPLRASRVLQEAIARVNPGITIAEAQSRVNGMVASLEQQFPNEYPPQSAWTIRLVPLKESVVGNVREPLVLLLCAVGLVLLIGCVNVANLLLARASVREREIAVRQALGAARTRLIRQLLTESLLLSFLGGLTGLVFLGAARAPLVRLLPASLPLLGDVSINWSVSFFALLACIFAGAIFGIAPALHAGRLDLTHVLKQEGRGSTGSHERARTRHVLVVIEFALSLILMVAASLLLRSFWDLLHAPLGFNPQNVMAVRLWLPIPNDPATDPYGTAATEAPLLREVLRRTSALPGVAEVALVNRAAIPLAHGQADLKLDSLVIDGREIRGQAPLVRRSVVTPGYFHLLGISLVRGRLFTDWDNDAAPPVAVINEAFARVHYPGEDPVGKHLKLNPASTVWTTVAGVVANTRAETLEQPEIPLIYLCAYQRRAKDLAILLRGRLDATAIPEQVREQIQSVDPTLPVFGAQSLDDAVAASLSERHFALRIIGLFALTALLLSGLGIYGVISYLVSERRHEFGIRLTLGAQASDVMRLVLEQGLRLAATGTAAGLAGALIVSHLMAGLLYGVRPYDPVAFVAVPAILFAVAVLATYLPARRATRVDPIIALRQS
jgi:predicted permease